MNKRAFPIALLTAFLLGSGGAASAAGAKDNMKQTFRKTERGLGGLLDGMGQELKKAQKKVPKLNAGKKGRERK